MTESIDAKVARLTSCIAQNMADSLRGIATRQQAEMNIETALRAELARPQEVTDAMIYEYLNTNEAYWLRTDDMPIAHKNPSRWRQGTPKEAIRESLQAVFKLLAATSTKPADNAAVQVEPDTSKVICPICVHQFRAIPQDVQGLMLDAGFEPPFTAPQVPTAQPISINQAVGRVIATDDFAAEIVWILNPLPPGTLLYEGPQISFAPTAPSMPPKEGV